MSRRARFVLAFMCACAIVGRNMPEQERDPVQMDPLMYEGKIR